jgi:hypothetical protein
MIETLPTDFILLTVTLSQLWRVLLVKQYQTTPSKVFQKRSHQKLKNGSRAKFCYDQKLKNRNSGRIGLVRSKVYASLVVLLLFITFRKNVLLHFPPIYHLSVTPYSELARREFPDHRTLR